MLDLILSTAVGIVTTGAYDIFKNIAKTALSTEENINDELIKNIYATIDDVSDQFFERYKTEFGSPEYSFLSWQCNLKLIISSFYYGSEIDLHKSFKKEGDNALEVSDEALNWFISELIKKAHTYHNLDKIITVKANFLNFNNKLDAIYENTAISSKIDWSNHQHATMLALLNLIGSWDDKNQADIKIINKVINENNTIWEQKVREILLFSDSPLTLHNGIWKIKERAFVWDKVGDRIFDQNLETFKELAKFVLTEHDPAFDLDKEKRYMANVQGKALKHSQSLRSGVAEGLAFLGCRSDALTNCSLENAEITAILTVRDIFANADYVLWGSLNTLLPILAEAAPLEFLSAVDDELQKNNCSFDDLFSQEVNGLWGYNYLTGLLWALEELAWDEKYLVRVCAILGELSKIDPGGNWANRPENSLITILLPWHPQTTATIAKRKVAVQTLCKECPQIGWKLLINLLPNQSQISTGSYKPTWRNPIADDWEPEVTNKDYWEQASFYGDLSIEMAHNNLDKINELIDHISNLPKSSFELLIEYLCCDDIISLSEIERLPLWEKLIFVINRFHYFSDAEWALDSNSLSSIEVISKKMIPLEPINLYRHLFSNQDFDLFENNDNWEEQQQKLQERRCKAITEILGLCKIEGIFKFIESVESPEQIGNALGLVSDDSIDTILIPLYLDTDNNKHKNFINTYVLCRYNINGWSWVDKFDKKDWTIRQINNFLCSLPFINETWLRAHKWLGDAENEYWQKTKNFSYRVDEHLNFAIEKLIEYDRPNAAIDCLYQMYYTKKHIDIGLCKKALIAALTTSEPSYTLNSHKIIKLIKILQELPESNSDDLLSIEWAYLPLLDQQSSTYPKLLEYRLACDPEFFCEVIRMSYRSNKIDTSTEKNNQRMEYAKNAWQLLYNWRIPPGLQKDGSFNETHFRTWISRVKEICTVTGHLEVALQTIGGVLIYSKPDKDGLWINCVVAEILNEKESEHMRNGFRTGTFNSRGVHWLDESGEQERELAKLYLKKAEDLENASYFRFAISLRNLADSSEREAKRIMNKHQIE